MGGMDGIDIQVIVTGLHPGAIDLLQGTELLQGIVVAGVVVEASLAVLLVIEAEQRGHTAGANHGASLPAQIG